MQHEQSDWTRGHDDNMAASVVKGAISGAVGVWVMDQVGWGMYLREDPQALRQEQMARVGGKDVAHVEIPPI